MRHRATGRHARYRTRTPVLSLLIAVMAALAMFLASGSVTGTFAPASARPLANRAPETSSGASAAMDQARIVQAVMTARMQAAVRGAAQAAASLAAHTYTVHSGDSISAVAAARCKQARDWTGIYAASRTLGWTAQNANNLTAGQHLYLSCAYLPSMLRYAPAPPPAVHAVVTAARTGYAGNSSGSAPAPRAAYIAPAAAYHGGSGYQACVIARESGGQVNVMNASGHYGLYQFDYGTWVSGGGAGSDFGHASVAEQNRVFAAVYAARGTSPWSPSDGC